jgi:hypothetical protein
MQPETQLKHQSAQQPAAQESALLLLAQVCRQRGWAQTLAGCGQQHRRHWQQQGFQRSQMVLLQRWERKTWQMAAAATAAIVL